VEKPFQLKLIIRRVSTTSSLRWLAGAWQLFKKAPIVFMAMFLLTACLGFLLQLNQLSAIVWVFLNPFLTAGFYKAIVGIQHQQNVTVDWVFKPLAEPQCRLILLAIGALKVLLLTPLISFQQKLLLPMSAAIENQSTADISISWQLLLLVALFSLVFMLFAYAVAIAYFLKEQRILAVVQTSFIACWRNVSALLIFGLLSMALVLLTLPTFFIGLIVVLPLLNIAFFLSFNDVFALQVKLPDDGVLEV